MYAIRSYYVEFEKELEFDQELKEEVELHKNLQAAVLDRITSYNVCYTKLLRAILQGIYRNPLVEPYTLGISGGAALGIAIAIVSGLNSLSFLTLPVFGFLGAVITLFLVYFLSIKRAGLSINT